MNLSLVLKQKTEVSHQQLEKILINKLKSISSVADYVEILKAFYSYINPLENSINHHIDKSIIPDYSKRRKSEPLKSDLAYFNSTPESPVSDIPPIQNTYQAIGALYVLEGSTLGGQIISKMISQKLQLPDLRGLSFFKSYGEETLSMWNTFKNTLNKQIAPEEHDSVVQTAEQTFIKFKNSLLHE